MNNKWQVSPNWYADGSKVVRLPSGYAFTIKPLDIKGQREHAMACMDSEVVHVLESIETPEFEHNSEESSDAEEPSDCAVGSVLAEIAKQNLTPKT